MRLANIFQDNMTLQRDIPIKIWGHSDTNENIEVKLNGKTIATENINDDFEFYLPKQNAVFGATLEIGPLKFSNVNIGEVWIAGGQSNMEFLLKYDKYRNEVFNKVENKDIRIFSVPKYYYEGEENDDYKDMTYYNKWLPLTNDFCDELPSLPVFFSILLQYELDVPVGIVNCNWGGTTALTWLDTDYLKGTPLEEDLNFYYNNMKNVDKDEYYEYNRQFRKRASSPMDLELSYHRTKNSMTKEDMDKMYDKLLPNYVDRDDFVKIDEELFAKYDGFVGDRDKNFPMHLYKTMLSQISGYSAKGVIWYQGESDEDRPHKYELLFTKVIECWRNDWGYDLPFVFAQLAPFGKWLHITGNAYPTLRDAQYNVSQKVNDTYIISTSDVGHPTDIHPKDKKTVGERFAKSVLKNIYGKGTIGNAPELDTVEILDNKIKIKFKYNTDLYVSDTDDNMGKYYSNIDDFIGQIKINDLTIKINNQETNYKFEIINNDLYILCPVNKNDKIEINLGYKDFYRLNIYNSSDIAVLPFLYKN